MVHDEPDVTHINASPLRSLRASLTPVSPRSPLTSSEGTSTPGTSIPPSGIEVIGRHTLLWQVRPEQHSAVSWQLRPEAWHAQRPPLQSM